MSFIATLKRLLGLGSSKDRHLVCQDCKKKFVFDEGEQRFFKAKGFSDPKRCPKCRKKVRPGGKGPNRSQGRSRGRGGRGFGRRPSRRNSIIDGNSPYQDA